MPCLRCAANRIHSVNNHFRDISNSGCCLLFHCSFWPCPCTSQEPYLYCRYCNVDRNLYVLYILKGGGLCVESTSVNAPVAMWLQVMHPLSWCANHTVHELMHGHSCLVYTVLPIHAISHHFGDISNSLCCFLMLCSFRPSPFSSQEESYRDPPSWLSP